MRDYSQVGHGDDGVRHTLPPDIARNVLRGRWLEFGWADVFEMHLVLPNRTAREDCRVSLANGYAPVDDKDLPFLANYIREWWIESPVADGETYGDHRTGAALRVEAAWEDRAAPMRAYRDKRGVAVVVTGILNLFVSLKVKCSVCNARAKSYIVAHGHWSEMRAMPEYFRSDTSPLCADCSADHELAKALVNRSTAATTRTLMRAINGKPDNYHLNMEKKYGKERVKRVARTLLATSSGGGDTPPLLVGIEW